MKRYIIQVLAEHDRSSFDSGVESLDRYLRQQAGQDQRRGLAVCYVLTEPESSLVLGYYTLSSTSIDPGSLPHTFVRRFGRYRLLPATLLGRLAVDSRRRGSGLGSLLLVDAMKRALEASRQVASLAVVVDALDDRATAFYKKYGFRAFEEDPLHLYMPLSEVRAALEEA